MSTLEARVDSAVEICLSDAQTDWRRVGTGEWGITAEACGWPLYVGLARRSGLLRAQAEVLGPGAADPAAVLRRNRALLLVRFGATANGAIWVQGEIPELAATASGEIDRLLGLCVQAAQELRAGYAAR